MRSMERKQKTKTSKPEEGRAEGVAWGGYIHDCQFSWLVSKPKTGNTAGG